VRNLPDEVVLIVEKSHPGDKENINFFRVNHLTLIMLQGKLETSGTIQAANLTFVKNGIVRWPPSSQTYKRA